jgi:hypothetical protein
MRGSSSLQMTPPHSSDEIEETSELYRNDEVEAAIDAWDPNIFLGLENNDPPIEVATLQFLAPTNEHAMPVAGVVLIETMQDNNNGGGDAAQMDEGPLQANEMGLSLMPFQDVDEHVYQVIYLNSMLYYLIGIVELDGHARHRCNVYQRAARGRHRCNPLPKRCSIDDPDKRRYRI